MKVDELIRSIRDLVLNHPDAAKEEIVLAPHGKGHAQVIGSVHLNLRGTKVIIEAEK